MCFLRPCARSRSQSRAASVARTRSTAWPRRRWPPGRPPRCRRDRPRRCRTQECRARPDPAVGRELGRGSAVGQTGSRLAEALGIPRCPPSRSSSRSSIWRMQSMPGFRAMVLGAMSASLRLGELLALISRETSSQGRSPSSVSSGTVADSAARRRPAHRPRPDLLGPTAFIGLFERNATNCLRCAVPVCRRCLLRRERTREFQR